MTLTEAIAAFRVLSEARVRPKAKPQMRRKAKIRPRPKFKLARKMGVKRAAPQQRVPREILEKAVQQWMLSMRAKTPKEQRSAMVAAMATVNSISKVNRMPVKRIAAQIEAEAKRRLERK